MMKIEIHVSKVKKSNLDAQDLKTNPQESMKTK
jgi:hypothetical protein